MAKNEFTNFNSLLNATKNQFNQVIEKNVTEFIKENYQEAISDTLYAKPKTSDWYENEFAMLNSITPQTKVGKDEMIVFAFADISKMNPPYMSLNGSFQSPNIVEWLNNGTSGSPIFNHPSYNFVEIAQSKVEVELKGFMIPLLRKRGLVVI